MGKSCIFADGGGWALHWLTSGLLVMEWGAGQEDCSIGNYIGD